MRRVWEPGGRREVATHWGKAVVYAKSKLDCIIRPPRANISAALGGQTVAM